MTAQSIDFQVSNELRGDLRRWRSRALPIGVVGLVVSGIGALFGRAAVDQFYHSYLWSYLFILGLVLGPLAWLLLQYLSGGAWGMVIRRPCEAALRTMPLVVLLFLPIVGGIRNLYPWSIQVNVNASAVLQHKHAYLNVPFFLARVALYFGGWWFLAWYYNRVSYREDTEGHDAVHGSMSTLAGPGIIFWAFTTTFMSIDWILSIHPEFFSTMFGLLFIAGQGLTGMAFLITVMVLLSRRRPMSEVLTPAHLHDLGKLLLAMVMVWAYFSFSQFLIIWAGNLPEEIPYYLKRINGGWGFLALVLVFGHFALPFALLLSRDLKRNFKLLASIAVFVLCMRLVDLYWVVTPEFRGPSFGISWMDITVPAGLIGLWLAFFLYQLEKRPLMPVNNPNLEDALHHGRE